MPSAGGAQGGRAGGLKEGGRDSSCRGIIMHPPKSGTEQPAPLAMATTTNAAAAAAATTAVAAAAGPAVDIPTDDDSPVDPAALHPRCLVGGCGCNRFVPRKRTATRATAPGAGTGGGDPGVMAEHAGRCDNSQCGHGRNAHDMLTESQVLYGRGAQSARTWPGREGESKRK